jgi:hypothetical protein
LLIFVPLLAGCDAWPTIIDNGSQQAIRFRYHESGHESWSAEFSLPAGEAQRLAREHWVQDILALRIEEAGHRYDFTYSELEPVRRACSSSLASCLLDLAPDCYVTYHGGGRLSASFQKPENLLFKDLRNGR